MIGVDKKGTTRRKFIKHAAAAGVGALAFAYVRPTLTTVGVKPAFAQTTPGAEGCTPGYWKNHVEYPWPSGYWPSEAFDSVFNVPGAPSPYWTSLGGGISLLSVLKQGGGQEKALGRHAVAALLNAADDNVVYGYTVTQVIDMVNGALASGDSTTIENTKNSLAGENERNCPGGARGVDPTDDIY